MKNLTINAFTGKSGSNQVAREPWEYLLAITKQELAKAPISYYTKSPRPVKVTLNDKSKVTSYYNPDKNAISISFFNIWKCFDSRELDYIKNNIDWARKLIRGQQYHELSHAILTPSMLMVRGGKRRHNDVFNVVEDERIETIHKDYYKGVNFKKAIMEICEWKGQEADNAWTYFFQTVRFRHGEQEHLDLVSDFIVKWFGLTGDAFQPRDGWSNQISYDYIRKVDQMRADMLELYRTIIKDWFMDNFPDELRAEAEKLFGQQPDYSDKEWKDAAEALIDGDNDDDDDDDVIVIDDPVTIDVSDGGDGPGPDGPKKKVIFKGKVTLTGERKGGGGGNSNTETEFQGGIDDQTTGEDKPEDQNNGKSGNGTEGTDRREGKNQNSQGGEGQDGEDSSSNQPGSPTSSAGKGGDPSNSEGAQTGEGTGEEGEGDRSRSQNGGKNPEELAKEAAEKAAEDIAKAIAAGKGGKNSLSDLANRDYDPDVYRGLEELFIKRVRKDRKTQGRNVGWTGRIDPRLLSKGNNSKTKKIFVKENKDESNKFKGKEFINLIMIQDTSGSYSSSERATNTIFEALDRIEALHKKMFRWNLITVSNGIDVREKDNHKIRACGGTELTPDIYGAIKGFESNKGLNIYVTLFDGSCYGGENFAAMNKKNSIIIDNRTDNQEDIDRYAPKAVRISVTDGDFAGKLYSILYKELDKILR